MKITLIRHTSVNVEPGICYGQSDVPLDESFSHTAEFIKHKLQVEKYDAIYCSPLSRCVKLAKYCGYETPILDKRLLEINFGDWEMKNWEQISDPRLQHWYDDWINEKPTNGESFQTLISRVEEFLDELKYLPHKQVAIFTHAGVIRAIRIINKLISIKEAFKHKIEYGDIVELNI